MGEQSNLVTVYTDGKIQRISCECQMTEMMIMVLVGELPCLFCREGGHFSSLDFTIHLSVTFAPYSHASISFSTVVVECGQQPPSTCGRPS